MGLVPRPLLDDIAEGRCLPFIGAGFSANAKVPRRQHMPTWAELTTTLATRGAIDVGDGPDVAQEYERLFGRVGLVDAIRRALHADSASPGQAHLAFAPLPFDTVYTTNFDLLIEDACHVVRRPFRSLVGELQLPFHAGSLAMSIVKMHGDLRHEEHIVVSRSDYDEFLERYPVIATHLSAMLITKTALFIGYSRTDPDFNQILTVIRSRLGRFHRMSYIVQFDATPEEVTRTLNDGLHIINLDTGRSRDRDAALARFFEEIQGEVDDLASQALRNRRPDAFAPSTSLRSLIPQVSSVPRPPEGPSQFCFVLMPFDESLGDVYHLALRPAITEVGLAPLRADEIASPGIIVEQIRGAIINARVCIADVTSLNPNVMYEIGMAQSMGKDLILICEDASRLPFDIKNFRVIQYDPTNLTALKEMVVEFLRSMTGLGEP